MSALRRALGANGRRYLLLAGAITTLDQWTKWMVEAHLPYPATHPLIDGFLNLVHVRNTGVAFGLFASDSGLGRIVLTALGCLALAVITVYFTRLPEHLRLPRLGLACVLGGAVGNLLDRIFAGAVTDFVDIYVGTYHWPAFNVADSAITVGIGLLILDSFRSHHSPSSATEPVPDPDAA